MNIKNLLKELSSATGIGHLNSARETLGRIISPFANIKNCGDSGLIASINSGKEKTILLDAHLDEVGFIVTNIDDEGFVTVAPCGGIDLRQLPTREVVIHSKNEIPGVFISTPPHLAKGDEKFTDISKIKIDTALGLKAKDIISVGDFVAYKPHFYELGQHRVSAKSLDDRAGCAVLLLLAEKLNGKDLPINVIMLFSHSEELGLRGARTAAFGIGADEAISIDVSFGDAPDVPSEKCGKLSDGVMIGFSPILSRRITRTLEDIAVKENIPFQREVMGSATGTNADVISISKDGISCGLVSIPLRNMHTDCEIIDLRDIEATVNLLESYILKGGSFNA